MIKGGRQRYGHLEGGWFPKQGKLLLSGGPLVALFLEYNAAVRVHFVPIFHT